MIRSWELKGLSVYNEVSEYPSGIAVSMNHDVYVSDASICHMYRFDSSGRLLRRWGGCGRADAEFDVPMGVKIAHHAQTEHSVMAEIHSVATFKAFPPGLISLCVSYVGSEVLYVADCFNDRLQLFQMDGQFIRKWGKTGLRDGELNKPKCCCIASDRVVYVGDGNDATYRVQAFDDGGNFIRKFSSSVYFGSVRDIVMSRDKRIYIADVCNSTVYCCRRDGFLLHKWRVNGVQGIAVGDEKIYLAGSDGLYICHTDGSYIHKWNPTGPVEKPLQHPWGVAIGLDGLVYIADSYNRRIVCANVER